MKQKTIKSHARWLTCLVALAVVFATFLAGTFTSQASTNVFGDIELKVGDTLGFVYYTSQPYTDTTEMHFTVNGRTSVARAYPNDGKCVFIFNDIYPHELAKEVTATIVVDGKETVSSTGLSIKTYLLQMLMNPKSSAAEKQFASDTLQYGEQTRLYRNANVAVEERDFVSITDDINPTIYTAYKPRDIESNFVGEANGLGVSASPIRLASIGIAYHNTNSYVITLQVPSGSNVDLSKIVVSIDGKDYTSSSFIKKNATQYEVHSKPINAYDIMDGDAAKTTQIQLKVNGKVVQQASYNVLDYIYQLQDTTETGSLALKYARSLYRYGQSAETAYNGKRVIAINLNKNPGNPVGEMVPSDVNAQTPIGGEIIAYYSDGTSEVISEGITWKNEDIYGNPIKIIDDTHTKTFVVEGSFTDTVSKKTYTVTGEITLHNDMVDVIRYTDPDIYRPTTYEATHTGQNSKLLCKWANGYESVRPGSPETLQMADYKTHEYGYHPIKTYYTDPKSGITLDDTTYLIVENPITQIVINNTTANFKDSAFNNSTTPAATTYTIHYKNGQTRTGLSTGTQLSYTGMAGGTTTVTYTFSWNDLVYDGYDINPQLTATGKLACPAYGTWTRKVNGSDVAYNQAARTVQNTCNANTQNPEKQLVISSAPSIRGGTVLSSANLTGSIGSTTNGQWSGGAVYVEYYNAAKENLGGSQVAYSSPGHTTTDFAKQVTVTAKYTGKAGVELSATKTNVTVQNYMKSVVQSSNAIVNAAKNTTTSGGTPPTNVTIPLTSTKSTLTATYYNGTTATVGSGTATSTNMYLGTGSTIYNDKLYVANITGTSIQDVERTQCTASASGTPNTAITITYTDDRSGATSYTGRTQTINNYKVTVRNTAISFVSGQTKLCTMTASTGTSNLTPTGTLQVNLTNGLKASVTPSSYTSVAAITTAAETASRTSTATYKATNGSTITTSVAVTVANPITSVARYTDPNNITLTKKTAITSSDLSGCVLSCTYTNGQTGTIGANVYSSLSSALISDSTRIKQVDIKAGYSSTYSSPAQVTVKVILLNPPSSASLSLSTCTSSSKGVLTASGLRPTGTATVTFSNTATATYSNTVQLIYKNGGVSDGTATTKENGTTSVTASLTVPAGSASYYRLVNGSNASATTQSAKAMTTSAATAYWNNNPSSVNVTAVSCSVANYTSSTTTPTCTLTVTYTNGATASKTGTCSAVANITDATHTVSRTTTCSYTANGVKKSQNKSVTITNNIEYYWCGNDISESFSGSTSKKITLSGTARYNNQYTNTLTADSITVKSITWNGSTTSNYSVSGGSITFTAGTYPAQFVASVTAKVNENGGRTDDIKITVTNGISNVKAYTNDGRTTAAPTATGKTESSYPILWYKSGNTSTITSAERLYFKVTYNTGSTYNTAYDSSYMSCTTNPGHTYAYTYANGSNTYNSTNSVKTTKWKFTENGYTASVEFKCVPKTAEGSTSTMEWDATNAKYASSDRKNAARGHLGNADFSVTFSYRKKNVWQNGVEYSTSSSTTQTGSDSQTWYWGYNTYDTSQTSTATGYRTLSYAMKSTFNSKTGQKYLTTGLENYKYGSHSSSDLCADTLKNGYEYWIELPITFEGYSLKRTGWFLFNWERCNYGSSSCEGTSIIWVDNTRATSTSGWYTGYRKIT